MTEQITHNTIGYYTCGNGFRNVAMKPNMYYSCPAAARDTENDYYVVATFALHSF